MCHGIEKIEEIRKEIENAVREDFKTKAPGELIKPKRIIAVLSRIVKKYMPDHVYKLRRDADIVNFIYFIEQMCDFNGKEQRMEEV